MQMFLISNMAVLLTTTIYGADFCPSNIVGYVGVFDQTLSGQGIGMATSDAHYTYFSNGDPPEPYVYEKLGSNRFRITNFDPDHPTNAWSHLLLTLTNTDSGTMFDEDANLLKGTFQMFRPSPPNLDVVLLNRTNVIIGVSSRAGLIIVLQQSTNVSAWSAVATNISWTGRWQISRPATAIDEAFYRAYVPTQ